MAGNTDTGNGTIQSYSKSKVDDFGTGGIRAHLILIVLALLMVINYMDRQILSAVMQPMKIDLGLSDTQAGSLHTVFLLSMAVLVFPVSYLLDLWSRRKLVAVMAITWSIFTYVTGLAKNFIGIFIPRAFVAVGESAFQPAGTAWVSAAYPASKRGTVNAIFEAAVPIGGAVGVMLGGYICTISGSWRLPFFVCAIPGIVMGIVALFLRDYKTAAPAQQNGNKQGLFSTGKRLLKIPTLAWLYFANALLMIMPLSALAWVPAFMMRAQGISAAKAGMLLGIISLIGVIGQLAGGVCADLWQRRNPKGRVLICVLACPLSAICYAYALFTGYMGLGLLAGIISSILSGACIPAVRTISQDVVTPDLKAASVGMTFLTLLVCGAGWSPMLVGIVSDYLGGGTEGLRIAMMSTCAFALIGSLLFWIAAKYYPADAERVKGIIIQAER